jgi:hypothetical protein
MEEVLQMLDLLPQRRPTDESPSPRLQEPGQVRLDLEEALLRLQEEVCHCVRQTILFWEVLFFVK